MLLRTTSGNIRRDYRAFGASMAQIPPWSQVDGRGTVAGRVITPDDASGLPAVGSAIRLISETMAMLPLMVYRGFNAQRKASDGWQAKLLLERPNADFSAFDFWQDVSASIEATGNAFIWKEKGPGSPVSALWHMDSHAIDIGRENGRRVFKWRRNNQKEEVFTSDQVLHIRGFTIRGGDRGLSPIGLHANLMGNVAAQEEYEGRFFANDATPGGVLEVPGAPNKKQRDELMEYWDAHHRGVGQSHRPAVLFAGAEWKAMGVSLQDAQFIETIRANVEQVARIFRVPKSLLELDQAYGGGQTTPENEMLRFLNHSIGPRLKRIERALAHDQDLFGSKNPYPLYDVNDLLRTDVRSRWDAWFRGRQSGVLLADEIRAELGLPPLPDGAGQVPQITPVGGSPNAMDGSSSNGSQPVAAE